MNDIFVTERLNKVFEIAKARIAIGSNEYLISNNLFSALLKENSGVLRELKEYFGDRVKYFIEIGDDSKEAHEIIYSKLLNCQVSMELDKVLQCSLRLMKKYNQIYLNEGHILNCLLSMSDLKTELSKDEIEGALKIVSKSRDLLVSLDNYIGSDIISESYTLKRATRIHIESLYEFIKNNFNKNWADNIRKGIDKDRSTVFIAMINDDIVGFAGYDVIGTQVGVFGPMGVEKGSRKKNIGKGLLDRCLKDMKEIGYKEVIINEAGPIEFYEKMCDAKLL